MGKRSGLGLRHVLGGLALIGAATSAEHAEAFCGFYVGGADAKLFNNATQVVLMREGTRTVLSMQNNYQGPPQGFAMVVPVPVVLQKENVKTLPKEVFAHVDQLSAPRLVEYWEQDPCGAPRWEEKRKRAMPMPPSAVARGPAKADDLGVTVEAKFAVGEYDVVILSAKDSGGLDTWLRQERYTIPAGAAPYLEPYVQAGSKFFVAKVDVAKVKFDKGMATLSPLRFHFDSETFSLPVRLGLMNSGGTQDLIVNVLARGQRYEVANYPNATIPTNFDVAEGAKTQFGPFYAALFDRTVAKIPKVVVTEYAWDASTCDPCPSPALDPSELSILGADVLSGEADSAPPPASRGRRPWGGGRGGFVLTRLHARYAKDSLGEDLVFRAAGPIAGGREVRGDKGALEHGATASGVNNFQGRYAVRHPWKGPVTCKDPQRGIWGGPPGGGRPPATPARDIAFAPRGKLQLAALVKGPVPEVVALPGAVTPLGSLVVPVSAAVTTDGVDAGASAEPPASSPEDAGEAPPADAGPAGPPPVAPDNRGCGCDVPGSRGSLAFGGGLTGLAIALAAFARRRR